MKERRRHARHLVRSLVYVKVGLENGGVVLNVSEGGLVLRAANALTGDDLARVRFQLPRVNNHLEINGQVIWISQSKKDAGVRFGEMSDDTRLRLTQWIASESSAAELQRWREIFSSAVRPPSSAPSAAKPAFSITNTGEPNLLAAPDVPAGQSPAAGTGAHHSPGVTTTPSANDALPKKKWQRALTLARQRSSVTPAVTGSAPAASAVPAAHEPGSPAPAAAPAKEQNPDSIATPLPEAQSAATQVQQQTSPASELVAPLPEIKIPSSDLEPPTQDFVITDTISSPPPGIPDKVTSSQSVRPLRKVLSLADSGNRVRAGWILAGLCGVLAILFLGLRKTTRAPSVTYVPPVVAPPSEQAEVSPPETPIPSDIPTSMPTGNPVRLVVTSPSVRSRRSKTKFPLATMPPPSSPHRLSRGDKLDNEIASMPALRTNTPNTPLPSIPGFVPSPPLLAPPAPKPLRPPHEQLLEHAYLLYRVEPAYPNDAAEQHIEGTVKMRSVIGKDGRVQKVNLLSGPPLLVEPAMNAAREWRYLPAILNGQPVEDEQEISIDFHLPR